MSKPRLLDLYCGAGGCSVGYYRAGFDVVGVDNRPMPRYPFEFHQEDALEFVGEHGKEFDVIHASPPCQAYTTLRHRAGKDYPDLFTATREAVLDTGRIYVIENVPGSPTQNGVILCGTQFGLGCSGRLLKRHRFFESNILILESMPHFCSSSLIGGVYGTGGGGKQPRGYKFKFMDGCTAMGIDWMNRYELAQAIPPAYTEWIGSNLIGVVL